LFSWFTLKLIQNCYHIGFALIFQFSNANFVAFRMKWIFNEGLENGNRKNVRKNAKTCKLSKKSKIFCCNHMTNILSQRCFKKGRRIEIFGRMKCNHYFIIYLTFFALKAVLVPSQISVVYSVYTASWWNWHPDDTTCDITHQPWVWRWKFGYFTSFLFVCADGFRFFSSFLSFKCSRIYIRIFYAYIYSVCAHFLSQS
jgi:hypothetical protein